MWYVFLKCLNAVMEADVEKDMIERKEITLQPTEQSMEDELVSILRRHLSFWT